MKYIIVSALFFLTINGNGQDFAKSMSNAKASYASGKLEDTHFALQQAMQEVDMTIGKEVLKLLPVKMSTLEANIIEDNVTSNVGFVGATIHRSYGKGEKKSELDIISNSPMVSMMNTLLNTPMLGGYMNDGKTKNIKIQGYKARMEKQQGMKEGTSDYDVQIPLGSTLITFKVTNSTDTEIMDLANTLPLQQIAKLIN